MKFKITLLALASAACLTACNDDFFDQVPDDRITIEQVFQRTSYSEKYLATVYSYILNEAHRTSPIPWDPCSDDLDVTYDREDYNSYQINLGNWSASSDYYEFWSHFYRGIRSATYFIQHIGDNQEMLNDPTRGPLVVEQYKNEARFLRAWFYYNLLRQYGPCVLLGDEVLPGDLDRDDVKMNLPRSSYDECVDYIVGELDDIIDNERLPLHFTSQADKDYGRATLAMCMGLKSRVLLLAASPQFNGNPAYANVVNNDGKHLFATERDPEKWKRAADAAKAIIDLNIFDLYKEYHTDGTLDPYMSCRNVFLEKLEQRGDDGSHLQQPFELGAFGVAPPVQRLREHGRDAAARRRVPHERRLGHHRRAGKGILDPGVQGCQIGLGLRSGRHAQHVRQPRTSILREHLLQRRLLDRRPEDPHPALLHGRFGQKGHMGLPPARATSPSRTYRHRAIH